MHTAVELNPNTVQCAAAAGGAREYGLRPVCISTPAAVHTNQNNNIYSSSTYWYGTVLPHRYYNYVRVPGWYNSLIRCHAHMHVMPFGARSGSRGHTACV